MDVVLPKWGMTMQEAVLQEWAVEVGSAVAEGQIIATFETDKAVMEVEAPQAGRIEALLVKPGDTLAVGAVMARIGED